MLSSAPNDRLCLTCPLQLANIVAETQQKWGKPMTKSTKLMFLGFLVMLAGAILLYSLATALPVENGRTINPLVSLFYQSVI